MKRTILNSSVLALCFSCAILTAFAQQSEQNPKILSQIKIEAFDWYAKRDVVEPTLIKNYRRSQPEGKSANIPAEDSSSDNESEKFIYRIRIRNLSGREIISIVWRYEFVNPLTKELMKSLEFASEVRIKPRRRKTIYAESFSPPASTVDVNLLLLNKKQPFLESAAIKSLNFAEISEPPRKK